MNKPVEMMKCSECAEPAVGVRSTQFAGEHPYCEQHAKEQNDFGCDDSYAYWYNLEDDK